jgi:hypothetical protein
MERVMLNEIELVEEILDLQNTVCFLQDQLRKEREMSRDTEAAKRELAYFEFSMRENAQALISRMCAAPLVIQYEAGEIIHTDAHPFCGDETCPCHDDKEAWHRECGFPILDGLMTESEASRLFYGKQL